MTTSPRILEFIKGLIELGVTKYQGEKFQFEAKHVDTDVGTPIGFQTPADDDDEDSSP